MSDSPSRLPARPSLEQLQKQAKELLRQYRAGDSAALERFRAVRSGRVTLAGAQFVLAREYGFESWAKLKHYVETAEPPASQQLPFYWIDRRENTISVRGSLSEKDWDAIIAAMKEHHITGLTAPGITDAALDRLSRLDHITHLNFDGSMQLTDDGLAHLARLSRLQELNFSGGKGQITDRGLQVLRHLTELRRFQISWQQNISDTGVANLRFCDHLESVDLLGTPTGDGAVRALAGKRKLRHFKTGRGVTDAGLAVLHQFPTFKQWQGGEISYSLMSAGAEPNHLLVDGPFTNSGIAALAGLDGLFALTFFWHCTGITPEGLGPLKFLPNLGFLGCSGELCNDQAMHHIAVLPRIRMLMAQGTVAGDAGFAALSRSHSIEYIWGRECPNLTGRGFGALAAMPCLRGLAVSCKNVDDAALSALPRFPALKDFMPMDVPNEGFRHIGRCTNLEALWCMYCRDTGDAATEHISGLPKLKSYYAGATQITDRSLEILARMSSLERLEFWNCSALTNRGILLLAGLPQLREIVLSGLPGVNREVTALFPAHAHVNYSP
jgi:hypothetical protein